MSNSFGQKVTLEIYDSPEQGAGLLFESKGLRVDFDIRILHSYRRATFTIFNLNSDTVQAITHGERYATLKTQLHDEDEYTLADRYFISNAIDRIIIPNSITTLYCYDKVKKNYLDKQLNLQVSNPTLKRIFDHISIYTKERDGTGGIIVEPIDFPDQILNAKEKRPWETWSGSVGAYFNKLAKSGYRFSWFTKDPNIIQAVHNPTWANKDLAFKDLKESDIIILDVNNMRSSPQIGPATLSITSNLDPTITSGIKVNINELVTTEVTEDEETLQVAENFVKRYIGINNQFQVLSVAHKGSNFTSQWDTEIGALAPEEGDSLATSNWFGYR